MITRLIFCFVMIVCLFTWGCESKISQQQKEAVRLAQPNYPPDEKEVEQLLSKEERDPEEQLKLGLAYFHGSGVNKDIDMAISLLNKSAQEGNIKAQRQLGFAYLSGIVGVDQNIPEAVKWISEAAENGESDSANVLGMLYQHGIGVNREVNLAQKWYHEAISIYQLGAEAGDEHSQYSLVLVMLALDYSMRDKGRLPATSYYHDSITWLEEASARGNAVARGLLNKLNREYPHSWSPGQHLLN